MTGVIIVAFVVVGMAIVGGIVLNRRSRRRFVDERTAVAAEYGLRVGPPGNRAVRINLVDHKPRRKFDNVMFDPENGHRVFRVTWTDTFDSSLRGSDGYDVLAGETKQVHRSHQRTCSLVGLSFDAPRCTLTRPSWTEIAVECDDEIFVDEVVTTSFRKAVSTYQPNGTDRSAELTIAIQGSRLLAMTNSLPFEQYPAFLDWTRELKAHLPSEWP